VCVTFSITHNLDEELNPMRRTLRQNGHSKHDIKHALVLRQRSQTQQEKLAGTVSNKINRFLVKHNIKTIHFTVKKNSHMQKDKLGLKVTGIDCVLCECGKVCVGQTGRSIETRCNV
jgi:hypothetical protein